MAMSEFNTLQLIEGQNSYTKSWNVIKTSWSKYAVIGSELQTMPRAPCLLVFHEMVIGLLLFRKLVNTMLNIEHPDVCFRLSCFQSTYSTLEVSYFMCYVNSPLTYLLTY